MILCGPAVLDDDAVHRLRTLHAARRNAHELEWRASYGSDIDAWRRARALAAEVAAAIQDFWKGVQP